MLSQYTEWKALYPDCILFFRMGEDLRDVLRRRPEGSEILDITLTARDPVESIPWRGCRGTR